MGVSGPQLFARYAYAPNALGYCGPADASALADGTDTEIRTVARRFSGVWPYLRVLSSMTAIADPLDPRLVESYWLGGGIGDDLDPGTFLSNLLALIGPLAGGYWQHLTTDLSQEASANHSFHVLGIYPWTRLLGRGRDDLPLHVLDNCRIAWARVCERDGTTLTIQGSGLQWDGYHLSLSEQPARLIQMTPAANDHIAIGDDIALHWDHICGRLDAAQLTRLTISTTHQLEATNRRLDDARARLR
ncbi:DUF6390 family protein [Nocardia alni]|uniref:DUF6390 family protein n=1 Tax=Nocardia alni TaxID=2815723 RepID=UPI001C230648|nr:DUF6390 family protein [Nocardia alni]